ncbi:Mobile element protein [Pseudomonas synxantha]|uniref:Mobile element protein n=1 Tax=Pseudomonas synxantha TaxID=47883 RepID=A0A3G7U5K0_9PSED|nr:Mobile element protein [Pseudomonas synxantha]
MIYKSKRDLRVIVEGMLYRMRTGCPRRDLPKALVIEPDMEWAFIDGSHAKTHQHSAGTTSENDEAIG